MRRFAISDIHGCAETFKALLKQINFTSSDELYLLGDYIDRGPDSKGVIDHIWGLQESGHQVFCLKGNHEQMLINAIDNWEERSRWLRHGGKETVESFWIDSLMEIPKQYIYWMRKLPHFLEINNYLLVHAGFQFGSSNPLRNEEAMLWIRNWYSTLNEDWLKGRIIVHGHTPIPKTSIEQMILNLETFPVLDIDAGCTFVEEEYGWLCAMDLGAKALFFERRK